MLLSPDLSLHSRLSAKLRRVSVNVAIGTSSTMSKSLGLVLNVSDDMTGPNVSPFIAKAFQDVGV